MARSDGPERPSLFDAVRQLGATLLGILHTRLALAGVELEEEVQRLVRIFLLAFAILLFAALGLLVASLVVVFAFPDGQRVAAMSVLAAIYIVVAAGLGWRLRALLALRPPLFAATLAELEKDRASLRPAAMPVAPSDGGPS